jgi:hypothetical protein
MIKWYKAFYSSKLQVYFFILYVCIYNILEPICFSFLYVYTNISLVYSYFILLLIYTLTNVVLFLLLLKSKFFFSLIFLFFTKPTHTFVWLHARKHVPSRYYNLARLLLCFIISLIFFLSFTRYKFN